MLGATDLCHQRTHSHDYPLEEPSTTPSRLLQLAMVTMHTERTSATKRSTKVIHEPDQRDERPQLLGKTQGAGALLTTEKGQVLRHIHMEDPEGPGA